MTRTEFEGAVLDLLNAHEALVEQFQLAGSSDDFIELLKVGLIPLFLFAKDLLLLSILESQIPYGTDLLESLDGNTSHLIQVNNIRRSNRSSGCWDRNTWLL